jgi:ADP-ribosylglycohydrolase
LWHLVQDHVPQEADRTVLEASERCWYSGAYLLETVPTVLHILMRHAADPEEAIIRAVNDTKDNDSIAAIVGAAVGALHGCTRLPERWKRGLLGRTQEGDYGWIFELIDGAIRRFGPAGGARTPARHAMMSRRRYHLVQRGP